MSQKTSRCGNIYQPSAPVLHSWSILWAGNKAMLLIEQALPTRTEQLDIAQFCFLAAHYQPFLNLRADPLSLVHGMHNPIKDHGVQCAIQYASP